MFKEILVLIIIYLKTTFNVESLHLDIKSEWSSVKTTLTESYYFTVFVIQRSFYLQGIPTDKKKKIIT